MGAEFQWVQWICLQDRKRGLRRTDGTQTAQRDVSDIFHDT